jgi:hypothetical protein
MLVEYSYACGDLWSNQGEVPNNGDACARHSIDDFLGRISGSRDDAQARAAVHDNRLELRHVSHIVSANMVPTMESRHQMAQMHAVTLEGRRTNEARYPVSTPTSTAARCVAPSTCTRAAIRSDGVANVWLSVTQDCHTFEPGCRPRSSRQASDT